MWHSEDDIIKDLAILNDSEIPKNKDLRKMLDFSKRIPKSQLKPEGPKVFTDPRTGEDIIIDEIILNPNESSKNMCRGRGKILRNSNKSELQLKEQLRLARPLGSSDAVIESYFNRNKNEAKVPEVENIEEDFLQQITEPTNFKSDKNSTVSNEHRRLKAVRSSTSQSNALLDSLLSTKKSKSKVSSETKNSNVKEIKKES